MATDRQVVTRPAARRRPWLAMAVLVAQLGLGACAAEAPGPPVEIAGTTLDGAELVLTAGDGPVVVNFWASWCGPCRREAPALNETATTWADRGVRVVGVNARDTATNAQAFVDEHELRFPSLFDPDQRVTAAFGADAPVALPTTLVLDDDGRVVVRLAGEVDTARLDAAIVQVLDGAGGASGAGVSGLLP